MREDFFNMTSEEVIQKIKTMELDELRGLLQSNDEDIKNILKNKEIVLELVNRSEYFYEYLSEEYKNDIDVVRVFLKKYCSDNYDLNGDNSYELFWEAFQIVDVYKLGLAYMLPNSLKNDAGFMKMVLGSMYAIDWKDKDYSLRDVYLEYAAFYQEEVGDGGSLYFPLLDYSCIFSEELLQDKDLLRKILFCADSECQQYIIDKYLDGKSPLVKEEETLVDPDEELLYRKYEFFRMSGKQYMKVYEFEEAISCFEKGISLFPYYHGCYYDKADCLIKLGRIDEAIEFLENVVSSEKLKNADKSHYAVCSNDATYSKYTYRLFIKIIENALLDARNKKKRGYVYRPRKRKEFL